jgi:CHAT domain-containing protein
LTGKQATEPALRHAHAPQLIHLATHGIFFTEEAPEELPTQVAARGLAPLFNQARAPEVTVQVLDSKPDDFASRSALIFAGASNAQRSVAADQDGVISEEEVRALNLWGTELVVLSACDTGRAAVQAGQGVYGLRRAFFVAGAETLVTSLWQVADRETGELMKSFYEKLLKEGQPRLGALQEAMKEVRRTRPHPYYWAPFIAIGRDAPLSGLVKQP